MCVCVCVCVCVWVVSTNTSVRVGSTQGKFFYRSLTGLNPAFFLDRLPYQN